VSANAVADASFLIDWARYSRSKLLFKLFEVVFIPESVLAELRGEKTLTWVAQGLEEGKLAVLPELPDASREALQLVSRSRRLPVRAVDYPEAYCMVIGRDLGYTVLTENGGALAVRDYDPAFAGVEVLRALDVLYRLWRLGHLESFKEELKLYERETKRLYTARDLAKYGDAL
jgi:hypothetical protein